MFCRYYTTKQRISPHTVSRIVCSCATSAARLTNIPTCRTRRCLRFVQHGIFLPSAVPFAYVFSFKPSFFAFLLRYIYRLCSIYSFRRLMNNVAVSGNCRSHQKRVWTNKLLGRKKKSNSFSSFLKILLYGKFSFLYLFFLKLSGVVGPSGA